VKKKKAKKPDEDYMTKNDDTNLKLKFVQTPDKFRTLYLESWEICMNTDGGELEWKRQNTEEGGPVENATLDEV